jgi:hypothetical protein
MQLQKLEFRRVLNTRVSQSFKDKGKKENALIAGS